MGRGPGRWQRLLLSVLDEYGYCPVAAVVENICNGQPTRADLVAARRAAKHLAETGRARAIYLPRCTVCGELYKGWGRCPCGGRVTHTLVLTKDATLRGVIVENQPTWISVASDQKSQEATLKGGKVGGPAPVTDKNGETVSPYPSVTQGGHRA